MRVLQSLLICLSSVCPFLIFPVAHGASTVGVQGGVNCPGAYKDAGSGKVCEAAPDYSDILYLGERSTQSCSPTYTRVNAGSSKWCVLYPINTR